MNVTIENELPLRSYLLGNLNRDKRQRIEQHLMIDSAALEELNRIEDELIDDYLEGALSRREKKSFETLFLSAPERRQKLDFAKALKRYIAAHGPKENPVPISENSRQAFWRSQHPVLRWSLIVSLLLMAVGGSWSGWQISRLKKALEETGIRQSQKQLIEMRNRNTELSLALQREQARLKLPEREAANPKRDDKRGLSSLLPGQMQPMFLSVTLAPGLLRDFGGSQKIHVPSGTDFVQFDLKTELPDYPQYQAALQRVDAGTVWTQISPKIGSGIQGQFFRLIVPAGVLRRGDYVLKLSGMTALRELEDIGSYYFRITPK